jgi:ribose transport system permease protein
VARWEATGVTIALVSLLVVLGALRPEFLDRGQLVDVLQQAVYVGILASGLSFLIAMNELDISIGSSYGLCVISAALLMQHGWNPWVAAAAALVAGIACGLVNALVTQVVGINALIATLATLSVFRGLTYALSEGQQITGLPLESSFFTILGGKSLLGLPLSVWVFFAVITVLTIILRFTPFGYRVLQIGSNGEAAAFSAVPVVRVRVQGYVMMGLLVGVAALLGLAYFTSGDPNAGAGFELSAVAAAVIGGTPLRGGTASVIGAGIGAVLLSAVVSGLAYFDIPANWSLFAIGMVILFAVSFDSVLRKRREGSLGG